MANNIAPEMPVDNDGMWLCEIIEKAPHPTTGVPIQELPVVGLTDVVAFPSAQEELKGAVTIHESLTVPLGNVAGTNVYFGYPNGESMATHLIPDFADEPVYIHFYSPSTRWHEVARTIVRNKRTAT